MQKKKKQHYVWKEYLRNWANNDKINKYLLNNKKVIYTNLVNTSQENYFYKIDNFSSEELKDITSLIELMCSESLKPEIYRIFITLGIISIQSKNPELKDYSEILHTNFFEDFFSIIESFGKEIIKVQSKKDLETLIDTENDYNNFLIFICFQFVRTKKIREAVTEQLVRHSYKNDTYWIFVSLIIGFELAISLAVRHDIEIVTLTNITENNFITTDSPVINIHDNENITINKWEFYYPLNPKTAILIKKSETNLTSEKVLDLNEVNNFNKMLWERAFENIYFINEMDIRNFC